MEKHPVTGRFGSRGEYLVLLQALIMGSFVITPAWPGSVPESGNTAFLVPLRWLAIVVLWSASAYFGIGGVSAIRRYLTPLPYPVDDNRLVVTGVYRLVRHPLYSAVLLAFSGWTIFALSLSHLAMTVAAWLFFRYKASKEEAWLTERHPEYPDYARTTGRFLPRFRPGRR